MDVRVGSIGTQFKLTAYFQEKVVLWLLQNGCDCYSWKKLLMVIILFFYNSGLIVVFVRESYLLKDDNHHGDSYPRTSWDRKKDEV